MGEKKEGGIKILSGGLFLIDKSEPFCSTFAASGSVSEKGDEKNERSLDLEDNIADCSSHGLGMISWCKL